MLKDAVCEICFDVNWISSNITHLVLLYHVQINELTFKGCIFTLDKLLNFCLGSFHATFNGFK